MVSLALCINSCTRPLLSVPMLIFCLCSVSEEREERLDVSPRILFPSGTIPSRGCNNHTLSNPHITLSFLSPHRPLFCSGFCGIPTSKRGADVSCCQILRADNHHPPAIEKREKQATATGTASISHHHVYNQFGPSPDPGLNSSVPKGLFDISGSLHINHPLLSGF